MRPYTRWARLIMPMIEENSPTCSRPSRVERLRMRGLPVTAPTRGPEVRCQTIQCAAYSSSSASPSMQTRYSDCAASAPMRSALALPRLRSRWITRSRSWRSAMALSTAAVLSRLPSLIAMTSKSGYFCSSALPMVSSALSPSLWQGMRIETFGKAASGGGSVRWRAWRSRRK